jgi:hypothetical protein
MSQITVFKMNMTHRNSRVRGCLLVRPKPLRVVKSIAPEEENIITLLLSPSLCQTKFIVNVLRSSGKYLYPRYYCSVGETGVCEPSLVLSTAIQFQPSRCLCYDSVRLCGFVKEFDKKCFTTDGIILFCKLCEVKVTAEKRFTVQQPCNTVKHRSCVNR